MWPTCENGDLLAFAEARAAGNDASETDLVVKRSTDHGRSWSALTVAVSRERFRGEYPAVTQITVGNPGPVVDRLGAGRRGRVVLPFMVENARVMITYSDDHGRSWASPVEITDSVRRPGWGWYAIGPGHSIQLERSSFAGRLVVPANHRVGARGADSGPLGAHVLLSDDGGKTWSLGAVDDSYEDDIGANETAAVELGDGRVYFNTRNQGGRNPAPRGQAWSLTGGASYDCNGDCAGSPYSPAPAALDPPIVQSSLLRAGRLVLFSGPDKSGPSARGRSDLTIRMSADAAQSWCDVRRINVGPAAYSDLVQLADDTFGVLFETGSQGPYERIDFARFHIPSAKLHLLSRRAVCLSFDFG